MKSEQDKRGVGRPRQYGEPKIQTTVRLPQSVIDFLKIKYGRVQTGIDRLVNDPCIEADRMDEPHIQSIVIDESTLETIGPGDREPDA